MAMEIQHYIDGKRVSDRKGRRSSSVFNPATGEVSGSVPIANEAEVADAVASASRAAPGRHHFDEPAS
jgi:malonate-semialdehyde dehydrogenase (acetylating)/methylmalonate-semialdehyde dehydrogenase